MIFDGDSQKVSARKRHRWSAHENMDAALYEWFKERRNHNIPISGSILMAKS
jgi:hypothetical protein